MPSTNDIFFFWLKSANTDNKHPLLTSTKANTVPLAQKKVPFRKKWRKKIKELAILVT